MAKPCADPAGRRHPHEDHLLAFLRKHAPDAGYVKKTAAFIRDNFPGSWPGLRPVLLKIHAEQRVKDEKKNQLF